MRCRGCNMTYAECRTGLTYRDVFGMLWVDSADSSHWRYKRRSTVLGLWHSIKQQIWCAHVEACEAQA